MTRQPTTPASSKESSPLFGRFIHGLSSAPVVLPAALLIALALLMEALFASRDDDSAPGGHLRIDPSRDGGFKQSAA